MQKVLQNFLGFRSTRVFTLLNLTSDEQSVMVATASYMRVELSPQIVIPMHVNTIDTIVHKIRALGSTQARCIWWTADTIHYCRRCRSLWHHEAENSGIQ